MLPAWWTTLPAWWDWNLSARMRLLSVGTAWVFVCLAWAPLGLLVALGALRFGWTILQTAWNQQLARVHPLGRRDWLDWALFGTALAMSVLVAALDRGGMPVPAPVVYGLVLTPLSVIQMRAAARAFSVHREVRASVRVISARVTASRELADAA